MLLAAILTSFKGGPIESTGHNVFPRNMLLVFFNSYKVQGHIHHKATHVQERVPCGTLTGRLRDHSDPFEFRPTPIHATPFETKLIHGIYCPSMALVLVYPKLRRSTGSDTHAFKMDQSTETINIIPTKANSSKQLRLHNELTRIHNNYFDLC